MRRWQMGISHDFFAISVSFRLSSEVTHFLRLSRPAKLPLQFLRWPARERVHTYQRQAQPPTACQLQQREMQRCHATSIPNGHFFCISALSPFLRQ